MGLHGKILITGGAGFLGRAIIKRATEEKWDCEISILSTDSTKHDKIKNQYPNVISHIGDISDAFVVSNAMRGIDTVIHAAAVKEIPTSEINTIDCIRTNVAGSMVVAYAAIQEHVKNILAISTDKCCHPANAYGASKYMMEKVWQECSRTDSGTVFNLVRYGNVLDSTASVLTKWKADYEAGKPIKMTDPQMTRFWISPDVAVDYVLAALNLSSGFIYVPKMKSLSLAKLAEYTIGAEVNEIERIPIRPGEKMHEELLTVEECEHAVDFEYGNFFVLEPTTMSLRKACRENAYTSWNAPRFTKDDFLAIFK